MAILVAVTLMPMLSTIIVLGVSMFIYLFAAGPERAVRDVLRGLVGSNGCDKTEGTENVGSDFVPMDNTGGDPKSSRLVPSVIAPLIRLLLEFDFYFYFYYFCYCYY